MRKPKPTKTMTCTSWKPARGAFGTTQATSYLPISHPAAPPALTSQCRLEAGAKPIKFPKAWPGLPARLTGIELPSLGPPPSLLSPGQSKRVEPSALFSTQLNGPIPGTLQPVKSPTFPVRFPAAAPALCDGILFPFWPLCWKFILMSNLHPSYFRIYASPSLGF